MSANILSSQMLYTVIQTKRIYCQRHYSSLKTFKHLLLRRKYLEYHNLGKNITTQAKKLTSAEVEDNPKSWIQQYDDFINQLESRGVDSLDSKFIPIKRRKSRAEGITPIHFVDFTRVQVSAGNGGDGSINFRQVYLNPAAGAAGGDGGNGGHVIFKATKNIKSLSGLKKLIFADSGERGGSDDCTGKGASDLILEVPVGTIFKRDGRVIGDFEEEGDMFIAARGGSGGKGNSFFTTSVDQTPRVAEYGGVGETFTYDVELRIMADIGLIGVPNAGKSTLLRAISRARPKVASYPFTTLNPHVGMVDFADYHQIAVADLPGLVKGSHSNLGLGMEFLRHVQRCSCLLFVLDGSEEDPLEQLDILKDELEIYESGLSQRPHAIVLNKIDLLQAQENLPLIRSKVNLPVIPISAKMGNNLVYLLAALRLLSELKSKKN